MSVKVKSKIKINKQKVKEIEDATILSLKQTATATLTDIISQGYIPFDSGNLQNEGTFVDIEEAENGKVSIVSSTPYARRLYYNADGFNFQSVNNSNARDHWFEPYIDGQDKDFIKETFKKFLKRNL